MHSLLHWQLELQLLAMQELGQPDEVFEPGEQTPWPVQELQPFHWQLELQERDWLPQFPQDWVCVAPGEQVPWPVQEP